MTLEAQPAGASDANREAPRSALPPVRELIIAMALTAALVLAVQCGPFDATPFEVGGVVTGFAAVWLALREHPWTWPVGISNAILYAIIFYRADALANAAFCLLLACLCIYGWVSWLFVDGKRAELPITWTPPREWLLLAIGVPLIAGAIAAARPVDDTCIVVLDAGSAALGVGGLVLQARKRIENWIIWLIMTAMQIPLLLASGMMLPAMTAWPYIALCALGFFIWLRRMKAPASALQLQTGERGPRHL